MHILAIETSCDDTGIAIYCHKQGLIAHKIHQQNKLHSLYGGVVPELASRDHSLTVLPLIQKILKETELSPKEIGGIAFTTGPGLMGSLLVGAAVSRSIAYAWNVRAIGIHHMEAHLLAVMLEAEKPSYPFLALLVSGGHTLLVEVKQLGCYHILGQSNDDAAGEAFDKTAKILGLPYPGGPHLAQLAQTGTPNRFNFPKPMTNRPGLDFSFSGLKTFARNTLAEHSTEQDKADIACAFQLAVIDTLVIKTKRAVEQTGLKKVVVAGGVGANLLLRTTLKEWGKKVGVELFYPRLEFCTDNAAMVAYAGCQRLMRGENDGLEIQTRARWSLSELRPPQSGEPLRS